MSLTQRVKQGFLRLPLAKKAILVSSGALMVSTVLPWYDERNSFGIGETYLGIQGPLFLVGMMVLGFGAVTFFNLFFPLMGRQFFNLKKRGGSVALVLGGEALLLLGVANSVFYHPEFGLNLSTKSTRFGMTVAFFAVGVMILSGWLARRKESDETEEVVEAVMEVETAREAGAGIAPSLRDAVPVYTPMPSYAPVQQQFVSQTEAGKTADAVDPLTLDAKTRYRMLQSQNRYGGQSRSNLWGGGSSSSYGRPNQEAPRDQSMDF